MILILMLWQKLFEKEKKLQKLTTENQRLKDTICKLKSSVYSDKILKTDNDVNFRTGLKKKSIFVKLHDKIAPFVNRRWTGAKSAVRHLKRCKGLKRFGPERI